MAIEVRPVKVTERGHWEALFNAYAEFYKLTVSAESKDKVWQWIHDPDNDFWCDVVADEAGVPYGFTQYQLMHRSLGGSMVCYLSDLYVGPSARGKGAGRALIDHVINFARDNDISNVRWLTQEFNYDARRLYDQYQPKSDFILYTVPV